MADLELPVIGAGCMSLRALIQQLGYQFRGKAVRLMQVKLTFISPL